MAKWRTEAEARQEILAMVGEYYHAFKEPKKAFKSGDRITMPVGCTMRRKCRH